MESNPLLIEISQPLEERRSTKRSNAGLFVLDSSAAARDFERAYLRESA
jgi:hypothetical protein